MKYLSKNKSILLKKFIQYYYDESSDTIMSINQLANHLDCTPGACRTMLKYFLESNFLYKKNSQIKIFKTKQLLGDNFILIIDEKNYNFVNENYKISINIKEFNYLETKINVEDINTIQEITFLLFLFAMNYHVFMKNHVYIKNNTIWYRKECYYKHSNETIYMIEFTQNENTFYFTEK